MIDCRKVTKTYSEGRSDLTIFSDISLELAPGETLGIVGSSGAGKTTLLNLLAGLDKPSTGQVFVAGQDIHRLREKATGDPAQPHHGLCLPVPSPVAGIYRPGKRRHAGSAGRASIAQTAATGPGPSWSASAWGSASGINRGSCPGVSVSAWPLPEPW